MPKGPQGQKRAATEESLVWQEVADAMAKENNCDVLLLNGLISRPLDIQLIDLCASRRRQANILFVLVTEGGDADPAYRIARCLQESYEVGLVVPVGEEHMYYAAMNSRACKLTALGGQYWRLANEGKL